MFNFWFMRPEWKKELGKGHHHKAFQLFKNRHPALVAHHMATREFEALTGVTVKRRNPKPETLPEPLDLTDLGSPE